MLFKSVWKWLLAVGNRVVIERVERQRLEDGEPVLLGAAATPTDRPGPVRPV